MIKHCSTCKNWSRFSIFNGPNNDKPTSIGACKILENSVNYFDGIEVAEKKIEDGKIGAENLYTHENFGCIHYETT